MPNLYRLENDAKPCELGGPPFILGSFLRFPSRAYSNWGISGDSKVLYERSLTTYQDEFAETSPAWMESVVEAAKRGGIGNRPQMLRDKTGKAAAALTKKMLKPKMQVDVLDVGCGAGGSLIAYINALKEQGIDYENRVHLTGVDLSRGSIWKAEDSLLEKGFETGRNLYIVHSRDVDMLSHIGEASQDLIINVAGIHANAYLEKPMEVISRILRPDGYFVSGDWHHGRWLHPYHTYKLLDEIDPDHFEWKNKGAFMDEFREKVPNAIEKVDLSSMHPADIQAIEEIGKYWKDGWAEVRREKILEGKLKPTDEQIVAEGHSPVEDYIYHAMRFSMPLDMFTREGILDKNPSQVVPGSNLNMVAVFRKVRR